MAIFKRNHLFQTIMWGIHVSFRGCKSSVSYIRVQFCHRATVFPLHTWALLCPFPEEDVWQKPGKSKNQTLPRVVGSGILEYLDQTKDHSTCLVDWTSREEIILLVDDCGFCNAKAWVDIFAKKLANKLTWRWMIIPWWWALTSYKWGSKYITPISRVGL